MSPPLAGMPFRRRMDGWIKDELSPRRLFASCNAALVLMLLELMFALSLVALVYRGPLAVRIPDVLGPLLLGNALLVATIAVFSSYGGTVASLQDAPAAILAAAVSALAAHGTDAEQLFANVVVLVAGSTFVAGVMYVLIGAFRLGSLVRFIPYPVVAGFLAGTGWLLATGGIGVAVELPFGPALLQPGALVRWAPAVLLGGAIALTVRRWSGPLALLAVFAVAALLFWGSMLLRGASLATVSGEGWLLGPFPGVAGLRVPPIFGSLEQVSWPALLSAVPLAAPAIVVSLLGLLLNAGSLELVVRRDIDLNRELLATGAANLLSSVCGGLIGFHAISASTLSYGIGKGKRLPGLLVAVLLIIVAATGTTLLSYIPRLLLAGLLIYVGLELLYAYVFAAWSSFSPPEYAVIVSILVIVAGYGFLWGVGAGLVMAVILFVVSYSRIDIVRHELSGATYRSRVNRSMRQTEVLQASGDRLVIYRLRGFVFFGTANMLFERVRERVLRASAVPYGPDLPGGSLEAPTALPGRTAGVRFVILDFSDVSGLDSTALLSFKKLLHFTGEHGIELLLSGLSERAREQMRRAGIADAPATHAELPQETNGARIFADLDRAIEACEDRIIADAQAEVEQLNALESQLPATLPDRSALVALITAMRRHELASGEVLIRQGDPPDQLFFIESGRLTAQLEQPGREPVRLETMHGGRMVGEVGFLLGTRRSASVVADGPSVVYSLTRDEWNELSRSRPQLAQSLNTLVLHLLSQRVAHLTRVVDALQ